MDLDECCFDGRAFAVGNGLGKDDVAIIIIEYEEVVVASAGGDEEATSLVAVGLACDNRDGAGVAGVGAFGGIVCGVEVLLDSGLWDQGQWGFWCFGGLDSLADLMHVPFGSSWRVGRVFVEADLGETWEVDEKVLFDGLLDS